eukprot:3910894-Pleurochrysis_carterae.AAC.1
MGRLSPSRSPAPHCARASREQRSKARLQYGANEVCIYLSPKSVNTASSQSRGPSPRDAARFELACARARALCWRECTGAACAPEAIVTDASFAAATFMPLT